MKKLLSLALALVLVLSVLSIAAAEAPATKHGLGMVTKVGSIADATAEKNGASQVNTTVCSVVLDADGKILSVIWDVQQTKIQFNVEARLSHPRNPLTKLKGRTYGCAKPAPSQGMFEQIEAFGLCAGKTWRSPRHPHYHAMKPSQVRCGRAESLAPSMAAITLVP